MPPPTLEELAAKGQQAQREQAHRREELALRADEERGRAELERERMASTPLAFLASGTAAVIIALAVAIGASNLAEHTRWLPLGTWGSSRREPLRATFVITIGVLPGLAVLVTQLIVWLHSRLAHPALIQWARTLPFAVRELFALLGGEWRSAQASVHFLNASAEDAELAASAATGAGFPAKAVDGVVEIQLPPSPWNSDDNGGFVRAFRRLVNVVLLPVHQRSPIGEVRFSK